jgi:hypothetical protein
MSTTKQAKKSTIAVKGKENKKKGAVEIPEAQVSEQTQFERYGEDDDFYRKWSGPVLLGGFLPAIMSLLVIFSGNLVLNSNQGTCGYPLSCNVTVFLLFDYP